MWPTGFLLKNVLQTCKPPFRFFKGNWLNLKNLFENFLKRTHDNKLSMTVICLSSNDNFGDSVRCLRRIYSTCKDPVKIENLRKYAEPNAWEAGFNRLCYSMSRKLQHVA